MKKLLQAIALAALATSATGCYSKATGYDAKFTFAYAAGMDFENFVKPIAPGAKLDVVAFANGTQDRLAITGAKSSKPGVLAIEAVRDKNIVLKAIAPGVSDIEITAKDAQGNTLVDRVYLHVDKPTIHKLEHICTEGPDATYVQGESVTIFHNLATSDGRPVIGYGYTPIRVEPESPLQLVPQPQGARWYEFSARSKTDKVTIQSTVDSSALSLRIVARGDLKAAILDCGDDECRTLERESRYVVARVRFGDAPVCNQNALTKAKSLTPDICTVTAKIDDSEKDENRDQLALITGVKFGVCKYEVTLPELDGGRGVRLLGQAKIGTVRFPGEGKVAPVPTELWIYRAFDWFVPNALVLACIAWLRRRSLAARLTGTFRRRRY